MIHMFEYDELAKNAVDVLDSYNFEPDICFCRDTKTLDPYDIREYLQAQHKGEVETALDDLSVDEFMEYLTIRYKVRWAEIVSYQMF